MKRSESRILTTHAGSLPRPPELRAMLDAKSQGQAYDQAEFDKSVTMAVKQVVDQQVELGIDIVGEGEESKPSFNAYLDERISGFELKELAPGQVPTMSSDGRDRTDFREFYAAMDSGGRTFADYGTRAAPRAQKRLVCTSPLSYIGQELVQIDINNFQAALEGVRYEGAFIPSLAPGTVDHRLYNNFYKTDEDFVYAIADVMKQEYEAISNAGFIVQIDDPGLPDTWDMLVSRPNLKEYQAYATLRIEALNHALTNIPSEKIRLHVCWGNYQGPHHYDIEIKKILPSILKAKPQALSFEGSNPRHSHEWMAFRDIKIPEEKILIPGVLDSTTNFVEHPELV